MYQRAQTNEAQERIVVSSAGSSGRETYLEQNFRETKAFSADCDDVFVSEHVGLNIVRTFRGRCELCVEVKDSVATFRW